jgi:hypothetical protein
MLRGVAWRAETKGWLQYQQRCGQRLQGSASHSLCRHVEMRAPKCFAVYTERQLRLLMSKTPRPSEVGPTCTVAAVGDKYAPVAVVHCCTCRASRVLLGKAQQCMHDAVQKGHAL